MTVRACLFVGVERATIVEDDLLLPAVPAVGTILHVRNGDGQPLRLSVRRVEMIGVPSNSGEPDRPTVQIYCDQPRNVLGKSATG